MWRAHVRGGTDQASIGVLPWRTTSTSMLKKGVDAWNAWRGENPDIVPDLSKADLSNARLNGAKLGFANLRGANLFEAWLGEADLSAANLIGASLFRADLIGANLWRTSSLPPWWRRTLRTLTSPAVASTAYPRGV